MPIEVLIAFIFMISCNFISQWFFCETTDYKVAFERSYFQAVAILIFVSIDLFKNNS